MVVCNITTHLSCLLLNYLDPRNTAPSGSRWHRILRSSVHILKPNWVTDQMLKLYRLLPLLIQRQRRSFSTLLTTMLSSSGPVTLVLRLHTLWWLQDLSQVEKIMECNSSWSKSEIWNLTNVCAECLLVILAPKSALISWTMVSWNSPTTDNQCLVLCLAM